MKTEHQTSGAYQTDLVHAFYRVLYFVVFGHLWISKLHLLNAACCLPFASGVRHCYCWTFNSYDSAGVRIKFRTNFETTREINVVKHSNAGELKNSYHRDDLTYTILCRHFRTIEFGFWGCHKWTVNVITIFLSICCLYFVFHLSHTAVSSFFPSTYRSYYFSWKSFSLQNILIHWRRKS